MSIASKKLIVFDLDGTLAKSKAPIDAEMANLLRALLKEKMVAVISGGMFEQFQKQLIDQLECGDEELQKLFIFPLSGASFYRYQYGEWQNVHFDSLTAAERTKIKDAFTKVFSEIHYQAPAETYGEVIEDRGSQITFSAVGQQAPLEEKEKWHTTNDRRQEMIAALQVYLPEFNVRIGGLTSIDVTQQGVNKYYGIEDMEKHLKVSRAEILFVGDALFPDGNDYLAALAGEQVVAVADPGETKDLIKQLIS